MVRLLPLVLLLAGCTTLWEHPTKSTHAEYNADVAECRAEPWRAFSWPYQDLPRCLEAKGWKAK